MIPTNGFAQRQWGILRSRWVRRWGLVLALAIATLVGVGWGHSAGVAVEPTLAQISLPSPTSALDNAKPTNVERYGEIEVAPVSLNGDTLFKVVAPTVRDRKNPGNQVPVEERAEAIAANLKRVIAEEQPESVREERGYATTFDPESFQTKVAQRGEQTVIVATDAYRSNPLELVTVSAKDANYYGVSVAELAEQWQTTLQTKLSKDLAERAPERFEKKLTLAGAIAAATVVSSLFLFGSQRLLAKQDQTLKHRQTQQVQEAIPEPQEPSPPAPGDLALASATTDAAATAVAQAQLAQASLPDEATSRTTVFQQRHVLRALRSQFTLTRRRRILAACRWLVGWGQIMVWLVGVAFIFQQFPSTRQIGVNLLEVPIFLLMVWFVVGWMNWIGDVLIDRAARIWEDDQFSRFPLFEIEDAQRKTLRISTTIKALRGLKTFVLSCFGVGVALQAVGVPIGSVLAGGAIIAFGISLAFQNLLKDLINGCLILWEDQYGIGDVVAIDGASGLVENMNLRITQLRDAEGRLITIPNSTISKVENLTRTWSRVNFDIEIDYGADVDRVLEVIHFVGQQLYTDGAWSDRIIEPPEVLGVDDLSHTGILIRVWIKTKPLQQWAVGREFRRRLHRVLIERNIHIGVPRQTLQAETDNLLIANLNGDRILADRESALHTTASTSSNLPAPPASPPPPTK